MKFVSMALDINGHAAEECYEYFITVIFSLVSTSTLPIKFLAPLCSSETGIGLTGHIC